MTPGNRHINTKQTDVPDKGPTAGDILAIRQAYKAWKERRGYATKDRSGNSKAARFARLDFGASSGGIKEE